MEDLLKNHRRAVASFIITKIEEYQFHLELIINSCNKTIILFFEQKQIPREIERAVVYGFSALTNCIQSIKDAMDTATNNDFSWSRIKALKYGNFMHDARNAVTHDGNPIISAYANGRYFVPEKICRINKRGLVTIPAPKADIRTICLEFTEDFCCLLRQTLLDAHNKPAFQSMPFSIQEMTSSIIESSVTPDFVRDAFRKDLNQITEQLKFAESNPSAQALKSLDRLAAYCEESQKISSKPT